MKWFKDFVAGGKARLARYNNATFKEGAMAAAALITTADGKIDASEIDGVVKFIAASEALSAFDASELGDLFRANCEKATDLFKKLDLIKKVAKLKADAPSADQCVRMAVIIANQDGDFAESEKKVVRDLCTALGLKADEYLE